MDKNDQQAIGYLFEKLANVERQAPPRDAEAERFIRDQIGRQPGAPYYMAQTIVVQEQALEAAQARIEELEHSASRQPSGGLFGGLFGGGSPAPRAGSVPRIGRGAAAGPSSRSRRPSSSAAAGAFSLARRRRRWASPAASCLPTPSAACSAPTKRRRLNPTLERTTPV